MRRKTLLNALSAMGIDKTDLKDILKSVEIDPSRRAETLSIQEFARISNKIGRQREL